MSKWQMEIFENYDDGLNDAQLFRIYREIFKSKEEERKRFNSICNKIKDDILTVFDATKFATGACVGAVTFTSLTVLSAPKQFFERSLT